MKSDIHFRISDTKLQRQLQRVFEFVNSHAEQAGEAPLNLSEFYRLCFRTGLPRVEKIYQEKKAAYSD